MTSRYFLPEPDGHAAWTKVKTSAMKRPYLDCGCRNSPGLDTYLHLGCPRIACKQHAEDPHECAEPEPETGPLWSKADIDYEVLRNTAYPRARGELEGQDITDMVARVSMPATTAIRFEVIEPDAPLLADVLQEPDRRPWWRFW